MFSNDTLDMDNPAHSEETERAIALLRLIPDVVGVVTFYAGSGDTFVAEDCRTTYASVELDRKSGNGSETSAPPRRLVCA